VRAAPRASTCFRFSFAFSATSARRARSSEDEHPDITATLLALDDVQRNADGRADLSPRRAAPAWRIPKFA